MSGVSQMRRGLRKFLAAVIVTIPSAYILWQWGYVDEPLFPELSYRGVDAHLSGADDPAFWTYVPWVFAIFIVMTIATTIIDRILANVLSDRRA